MSYVDYIIITIASAISLIIQQESYSKLSRNKLRGLNKKMIVIVIISSIFITINTYMNDGYIRAFMNFMIQLITTLFIFRDNFSKTIYYTLYCFIIMFFYEIVLSSIVQIYFNDLSAFDTNVIFKVLFSIISMSLVLGTCYITRVRKLANKLSSKFNGHKIILFIFSISLISLIFIDFKYSVTLSGRVYIGNIMIMISILVLLLINIYNYFKINKEVEKTEVLLNFMSKYEKIIDDDRINRHEMLNNLLILKSFENKNSDEFNEVLDELITLYNKKGIGVKNIYKLPSGLKGIFYYKLNGLDEKGFNISINISKQIVSHLKKLSRKDYLTLYKLVGILLDNAIEASSVSKDKIINISIYKEKSNCIISIDNSFKGKVNLNKINNKYYSTKGKNRGLGLYIINNLLKDTNNIELEQEIVDKIFSTKIIVK